MTIKGLIKKGEYFDSVSLMIVSQNLNKVEGVLDSSVVMGTHENKAILKTAELFVPVFEKSSDTDLLIAIKAENEILANNAILKVDELLKNIRKKDDSSGEFAPKSISGAVKQMPEANLVLISIAGKYAAKEAREALENGINVMMFSDNVTIADELELKQLAHSKGLLMMGPDCGTAIINQIPLAFANVVSKGNIGIVAASGTGLQEVSCIISNEGAGISQAIGIGGRDVKKDIGGIMFIDALRALNQDDETKVIVLVSKPPHEDVLKKIADEIAKIKKPVVGIFIGGNPDVIRKAGAIPANNLEEAALIATFLSKNKNLETVYQSLEKRNLEIKETAKKISKKVKGKYLRGLFSGGTLCDESQLILKNYIGDCFGNSPLNPEKVLKDVWKSEKHTIIDLGEDEFTAGRPHPMIDYSLRCKRIIQEAKGSETAIILLDVVLGYGSHLNPDKELVPVIAEAKKINPDLPIICSITGTEGDPQNRRQVKKNLEEAGAIVMQSNVAATILCGEILNLI